ncbi:MAG: MipA/OmpV family protein [Gammaproteobacteria bacterium]|nr:MipA/OmpV family protein [Gammaproteobacteria bacterium]
MNINQRMVCDVIVKRAKSKRHIGRSITVKNNFLVVILFSVLSTSVIAQEKFVFNSSEVVINGESFHGVVVPSLSVDELPYRSVDTQITPSLLVMGQIGKVFIEGNRIGYLITRGDHGGFSAIAQVRSHQYLPKDNELGITARDKAFEIGAQLAKPLGSDWFAQLTALTDVSNTHKGQELELSVYRRDFFGDFRLLSLFAAQQQSKKLTGYYSDVDLVEDENHRAGADLNFEFELIGVYDITENINAVFVYRHYLHGDGLANSPLSSNDQTQRLVLGVGWTF